MNKMADLMIFLFYLFGSIGSWHWRWTVLCWFGQRRNLPNWRWQKSTSSWIHSWWTAYDCFGGKTKANETYSCQSSGPTYRYRMDQSGWHQKLFDFCHWSHAGRTRRYFFCLKILSLANFLVQVNLFQKYLFLHQLTQNMTKDSWLNYQFCTWKFIA